MKTLLIYLSLFLTVSISAQVEWKLQASGTTYDLKDIYFVTDNIGYIVGNAGTVLKTNNSGATWTNLETEIISDIHTVWFINEQTGFIGGNGGNKVYRTDDGGLNWDAIDTGLMTDIWEVVNDIHFIDDQIGFVGADSGIARTMDGGTTWEVLDASFQLIEKIDFFESSIGYASASLGILKTTDAGQNWSVQKASGDNDFNHGAIVRSIQAVTIDTVYFGASYYSSFYSSIDGAQNLNYQPTKITGLDFVSPKIGFAISQANDFRNTIIKTTDLGETWEVQFASTEFELDVLKTIWMQNEHKGWAAGDDGVIRQLNVGQPTNTDELALKKITVYPNPVSA